MTSCTIFTSWGEPFHVVDKTMDEIVALAEANRPFRFVTDTLPGETSAAWIRAGHVCVVVQDQQETP